MDGTAALRELGTIASGAPTTEPSVDWATDSDDAEVRQLLRENPMSGNIQLSLEREPRAAIAARVEGHPHRSVVWRAGGRVVGVGTRAVMDVFVDGQPQRVGYLSQLRIHRDFRGRLRPILAGYRLLLSARSRDEEAYDLTSILEDNLAARRLLEAQLPGLPRYRPLGRFSTLVLSTHRYSRRRRSNGVPVVTAEDEHLHEIAQCLDRNNRRFQFARQSDREGLLSSEHSPGLAATDFRMAVRAGRVVGCLALWDQTAFKQTVVRGYSRGLAFWRPAINGVARVLCTPRLPAPDEALPHAFLSHVAVDGDDPDVFLALVDAALLTARQRRHLYVVAGFAETHPLRVTATAFGHREVWSRLYAVHWPGEEGALAELARLVPHPEVARL
jgi:hypothetical protein